MNEENLNPTDAKLSSLLREARSSHALPPRFQEGVWRRIEGNEAPARSAQGWLDRFASWALRPRLVFAMAVVLICAGSLAGAAQGSRDAHQEAQNRYVAAVAPNSLR